MKPIQLKRPVIKIPFEDDGKELFVFEFEKTDKNYDQLFKTSDELEKELAVVQENPEATFEDLNAINRKAFDGLLGKGAYDKIYSVVPNFEDAYAIFIAICERIKEEISRERLNQKKVIDRYVNGK